MRHLTFALALAAVLSVPVAGGELPKLPADRDLPKGAESPGAVTFRHTSHVDSSRPDCTPCHPGTFRILKHAGSARPVITHAAMDKGRACGTCHDGKRAFGREDCTACHEPQ